jgi:hypothetical protein
MAAALLGGAYNSLPSPRRRALSLFPQKDSGFRAGSPLLEEWARDPHPPGLIGALIGS